MRHFQCSISKLPPRNRLCRFQKHWVTKQRNLFSIFFIQRVFTSLRLFIYFRFINTTTTKRVNWRVFILKALLFNPQNVFLLKLFEFYYFVDARKSGKVLRKFLSSVTEINSRLPIITKHADRRCGHSNAEKCKRRYSFEITLSD